MARQVARNISRPKENANSAVISLVEDKDPELVAKRRGQLIEAAIKLFSHNGYYVVSVKDVADAAGVSAGLIYQYVPDKQDLLFLCLRYIVERSQAEIPAALEGVSDKLARLAAAVEAYARIIDANRRATLLTYRSTKSLKPEHIVQMKKMELETNALIAACVEECIEAGYLMPTNVDLLVYRMITGAHIWALKHWRLRSITNLDEYIEEAIHACWKALLTPAGRKHAEQIAPRRSGGKGRAKAKG